MKLEFEPKLIEVEYRKTNGKVEKEKTEIGFILQDSIIPGNVFTAKFKEIDQLDTHDPFFN